MIEILKPFSDFLATISSPDCNLLSATCHSVLSTLSHFHSMNIFAGSFTCLLLLHMCSNIYTISVKLYFLLFICYCASSFFLQIHIYCKILIFYNCFHIKILLLFSIIFIFYSASYFNLISSFEQRNTTRVYSKYNLVCCMRCWKYL